MDLQSRVAQEVNKCDTILAQIGQIQQQAVAGIFVATVPPIWRMELWPDALDALPGHLRRAGSAQWSEIVQYLREPHQGSALHAALFIVLAVVFCCGAAQARCLGEVRRGGIVGHLGLQATLRGGVGDDVDICDFAVFSGAYRGATTPDNSNASADAPGGAADAQRFGARR